MKAFSGYDEIKVNEYGERLKLGGHYCKILAISIQKIVSKKDNKEYEQLVVKFDLDSDDEQKDYYKNKFVKDSETDALNAKWKGIYKLSIPENNSEEFIKKNFKTFITSIEESNPGYKWNWEENTLVGKRFGGVFGIEEFTSPTNGDTIPLTKIRFIRSIDSVKDCNIPKVKLADNTYIDYNEYIEKKKNKKETNNNSSNNNLSEGILGDDELPF